MTALETNARLGGIERFASAFGRVTVPPEDRALSPYTGLTRAHWAAVADDLLLSVARYRSPGGARIDLPGRPSQQGVRTDGLEGFARTFLLAAFRHVGEGGRAPYDHLSPYLDGLVAGTRTVGADDDESYPVIGDIGRHGQPHVEAASIALSMQLTRADTWDRLDAGAQDRLDGWLRQAIHREPSDNNWYLFPLTIASFLESVGRADEQTGYVIERGLSLIDGWYRGEGWYSDGAADAFDHYIGWALHLYPLLHARHRGDHALEEKLTQRLREFLGTYSHMFDRNGAPLYQGRSLTYRTATLAAVAMGEVFGATPLEHGQSRRIMSANLRFFFEHDATRDGVLTLGWFGEHAPTLQRYSGPGSPYWASKGFAALMLPAEHPLWTSTEAELPGDVRDHAHTIRPVSWLIQTTASDGLARVHNHGSDHVKLFREPDAGAPDPLYARFAYSTRTGPTALHNASDNDIQVRYRDVWSVRRKIHAVTGGADWVASWHAPRFPLYAPFDASDPADGGPVLPSVRIESLTAVHGRVEVRAFRLRNVPPRLPVRLSGWAVAGDAPEDFTTHVDGAEATIHVETPDGRLTSQLLGVHGLGEATCAGAPYGTAFGRWSVMPEVRGLASGRVYVALASLTADPAPAPLAELAAVEVDGSAVAIDWLDDGTRLVLDLRQMPW
ncbi:DUF2264 domain-containing protein [Plantactinospora siamensis]|uniref:DUF2264 domain-containing protein n=1 Tax=Plantactinospora siamensis TaxID=555372 RepID=A0ABV6NUH4_9ACTN